MLFLYLYLSFVLFAIDLDSDVNYYWRFPPCLLCSFVYLDYFFCSVTVITLGVVTLDIYVCLPHFNRVALAALLDVGATGDSEQQ